MLVYEVEVLIFPNIFLQKIMPSIQFYLFAHVCLNLANHFLSFYEVICKKVV